MLCACCTSHTSKASAKMFPHCYQSGGPRLMPKGGPGSKSSESFRDHCAYWCSAISWACCTLHHMMSLQVEALPRSAPSFRLSRKVATSLQHIKRKPRSATRTTCRATDSASSESLGAQSTLTLALKEWAVTCGALGKGDQTVSRVAALWACCRLQVGCKVAALDSLSISHISLTGHLAERWHPRTNLQGSS